MATLSELFKALARGDPFSPAQMDELQRAGRDLDTMRAQVQNWSQLGLSDPSFGEVRARSGIFEIPPNEALFSNISSFTATTGVETNITSLGTEENHGTLFRVESGKIYVTTPSKRIVILAELRIAAGITLSTFSWKPYIKNGAGVTIDDLTPATQTRYTSAISGTDTFISLLRRAFSDSDFAEGDPYIEINVDHDASTNMTTSKAQFVVLSL
jgi:hypothetical protein